MVAPVNVGDVLADKYEVERVLGEGGMGVVVAARHLLLGERVAIKFLLPKARERADLVARFLREGQAAARIRSEHVTRVYDVGTLARGEPYLVMEYLEGTDLKALLRDRGPLPVELACDYLLQACEALAEAHALGIVHRDLKPGNLFLSRRADGSPLLKVIDFGISKMALSAEPAAPREHDMTESSAMLGSPLYMAPEQMVSSKNVDARADVWSMGAILYQLLTGAIPFRGDSVMEIYDRILEGPPRLGALRADVPGRIDWVVQRCLQKSPADRFGNIAELAAELAPFAPAHAQHLAERAARVLQVRRDSTVEGAASGRSLPPLPRPLSTAPGPPGGTPQPGRNSSGPTVPAGSAWGPPTVNLADGAATDRSWGGTRASSGRPGARAVGVAAGIAAAVLGAAGLAWLALRPPASDAVPTASGALSSAPDAPPRADLPPAADPAAGRGPALLDGGSATQAGASATAQPAAGVTAPQAGASATAQPAAGATAPQAGASVTAQPAAGATAPQAGASVTAQPRAGGAAAPQPTSVKGTRPSGRPSPPPRPTAPRPDDLFSDPR
ncbi:protein kinase domain-containing protein [Sorangium sp. So ce1097]|uniref:serine/threonine-protein kinase n=1 Tax=Sorangium sp. So ce1097 TaxID=3133330 RepID=UPI003F6357F9